MKNADNNIASCLVCDHCYLVFSLHKFTDLFAVLLGVFDTYSYMYAVLGIFIAVRLVRDIAHNHLPF